ncbi:uncharacterized protein LOC108864074 [Galendromus occidentalis]|uniref:Uncharacterized protein LOC108864074 n=1 Tax=Galendromus occidentalis TaxID=34638 RepID=A0AAJ7L5H1_9ACAR|nr:uncharacterized protein LOC108864074 [Galendromus occidentalis]
MAPPVQHSPPCTRAASAAKRTTGQQVDDPGEETNGVTFSVRPKQGSQEMTAAAINVDLGVACSPPELAPSVDPTPTIISQRMQSLVVQTQKEPPKFNGRSDWLREFKRVASFNGHTETQMLANAPFCLVGEALDWFDNEDDQVDQWERLETNFCYRFADTTKISEEAREKLKRLIYERGTSFTGHLESVLKLCRKLDSRLSEDETIRKVIQTFPRDQAMTLVSKAPKTIAELRAHMSYLDRTIPFVNQRDTDTSAINAVNRSGTSRSRSSERGYSVGQFRPSDPTRSVNPPNTGSPGRKTPIYVQHAQRITSGPFFSGNRRTPDGIPLCNWCNLEGHIIKYCLKQQRGYPAVKPVSSADQNQSLNSKTRSGN